MPPRKVFVRLRPRSRGFSHQTPHKIRDPTVRKDPRPHKAKSEALTGIAQRDESSAPVQLSNDLPFRSSPLKKVRYVITWYPTNCFWLG